MRSQCLSHRPAAILCDSKYIVDGCNGQAKKRQRNSWRTTSRLVVHTDLWNQVLFLLEVCASHVAVHHIPSHSGWTANDLVDQLAGQGHMHRPLWTVNTILPDSAARQL